MHDIPRVFPFAAAIPSNWDSATAGPDKNEYTVTAAATLLRSVTEDAATVSAIGRWISESAVLVEHSRGEPVITEAAGGNANMNTLVYVATFAPDSWESDLMLPDTTLAGDIVPIVLPDDGQDLFIQRHKLRTQFTVSVPEEQNSSNPQRNS